ncbi:MAG: serine acetyltransferase [Pseudomonadota bacterium]|nr:serine acetyltransferase [Pseudomonadota bacterium]
MFKKLKVDAEHRRIWAVDGGLNGSGAGHLLSRTWLATCVYRFGRYANEIDIKPLKVVCKVLYYPLFFITQGVTGISVQAHCKIQPGLVLNGTGGLFILAETIGENFVVGSGVTVGNVRGSKNLPVIGNNVCIEPGAKILGEVTIGDNVLIRANSLVLTDIPDNTMAVGNPARIKRKPDESES